MRNVLKRIFEFMSFFLWCLVLEILSIYFFTFVMHSGLRQIQKIAPLNHPFLWEAWPPSPPTRGSAPSWLRMLLDGIPNLTGLNLVRKNFIHFFSQVPSLLLTTVEYNINYISKTENCIKKNSSTQKFVSGDCASFETAFFPHTWSVKTLENCEQNRS